MLCFGLSFGPAELPALSHDETFPVHHTYGSMGRLSGPGSAVGRMASEGESMTPQEAQMLQDLVQKVQGTELTEKDPDAEALLEAAVLIFLGTSSFRGATFSISSAARFRPAEAIASWRAGY